MLTNRQSSFLAHFYTRTDFYESFGQSHVFHVNKTVWVLGSLPTIPFSSSSVDFCCTAIATSTMKYQDYTPNSLLTTAPSTHHNPMCSSSDKKNAIAALSSSDKDKESDMLAINKTRVTQNHMTQRNMGYPLCIDKLYDNQQSNNNNECTQKSSMNNNNVQLSILRKLITFDLPLSKMY